MFFVRVLHASEEDVRTSVTALAFWVNEFAAVVTLELEPKDVPKEE